MNLFHDKGAHSRVPYEELQLSRMSETLITASTWLSWCKWPFYYTVSYYSTVLYQVFCTFWRKKISYSFSTWIFEESLYEKNLYTMYKKFFCGKSHSDTGQQIQHWPPSRGEEENLILDRFWWCVTALYFLILIGNERATITRNTYGINNALLRDCKKGAPCWTTQSRAPIQIKTNRLKRV